MKWLRSLFNRKSEFARLVDENQRLARKQDVIKARRKVIADRMNFLNLTKKVD